MLLKSFLDDIPKELDEQACIDGCSRFMAFVYIILPAMAPGIVAAVVFVSVFAWNDFAFAFLVSGTNTKTIPIIIMEMQGLVDEGFLNWGTIFAASVIQLIPILMFIFFLQKKLVKGFTLGAIKG
jgi:multiple sugar transport system permease protein